MSVLKQVSRRHFIKNLFAGALGVAALPFFGRKLIESAHAENKACSPTEPMGQAIGYVEKAKDKKKLCSDCMFFHPVAPQNKVGTCDLMPNCVVPTGGSCNSFQKKV